MIVWMSIRQSECAMERKSIGTIEWESFEMLRQKLFLLTLIR
jgi:hypothetical protein